jgi:hypothetical protein
MTTQWTNLSRGFQGGFYTSCPVEVFNEGGEIVELTFAIKQVDDNYFLLLKIEEFRFILGLKESSCYSNWCLGEDFADEITAMEFTEYVIQSFIKHQCLCCVPFKDQDHWIFNRL